MSNITPLRAGPAADLDTAEAIIIELETSVGCCQSIYATHVDPGSCPATGLERVVHIVSKMEDEIARLRTALGM